jgi:adenine-specific DNA-methyltransferase
MVHVGAVDAPVTLADVKAIAKEVWRSVGAGSARPGGSAERSPTTAAVDILGWEFAFELNETARQTAAESRVNVTFKKIPHEALDKKAVEQGDVTFFELGALLVDVKVKKREVKLTLEDFAIPIDDIPIEVRKAIKHWSQLVDYWAVDWDYKGDTFHNQWQSYRTRKDPKISLDVSYVYPEPGKYTVVIKVIDILGNDTTKTLDVTVK